MKKRLVKGKMQGFNMVPQDTECRRQPKVCNSCNFCGGVASEEKGFFWCFDVTKPPRKSIKI